MSGAAATILIARIKLELGTAHPLAQSTIAAVPVVALGLSNPVDMFQAARAWKDISDDLNVAVELLGQNLPGESDWEGFGRKEFDNAMVKYKAEWGQLSSAASGLSTTLYTVLGAYIAYYLGLVALWFALNAYLRALLPALAPPTTGFAKTLMEGAGITGVEVTAAATGALKAGLSGVGLGLVGAYAGGLTGILGADTNSADPKNDFEEIVIQYPEVKI